MNMFKKSLAATAAVFCLFATQSSYAFDYVSCSFAGDYRCTTPATFVPANRDAVIVAGTALDDPSSSNYPVIRYEVKTRYTGKVYASGTFTGNFFQNLNSTASVRYLSASISYSYGPWRQKTSVSLYSYPQ